MAMQNIPSFHDANPQTALELKKQADMHASYTDSLDYLKYSVPGMFIGAAADITNGVGGDVSPEEIQQGLADMGVENFGSFYAQHEEGLRLAGTIATSFVPILGATKLVRAGNMLDKAFGKMGVVGEYARKATISSGLTRAEQVEKFKQSTAYASILENRGKSIGDARAWISQAARAQTKDVLKESIAAEAVLYALYYDDKTVANHTNTLYSDSSMANFLFAAVPTAAFAGFAYTGTARALNSWAADAGSEAIEAAGKLHDVENTNAIFRTGNGGVAMAVHAQDIAGNRAVGKAAVDNEMLRTNAGNSAKASEETLRVLVGKMANSEALGKQITPNVKPENFVGETDTVLLHSINEPSSTIGVLHYQPATREAMEALPKMQKVRIALLQKKLEAFPTEAQRVAMEAEIRQLQEATHTVLLTDGHVIPFNDWRPSLMDNVEKLGIKTSTKEKITQLPANVANTVGANILIDSGGDIIIQATKAAQKELQQARHATVSMTQAEAYATEPVTLLNDFMHTWDVSNPTTMGARVFKKLADDEQKALLAWQESSRGSMLREWSVTNPEKIDAIQQVYRDADFHKRMFELADDQGMLTLYRGESIAETAKPTNDLISVSSNPKMADTFAGGTGKHVVKVRVHVDDIVAPIANKSSLQENEFIVRNATKRFDPAREAEARLPVSKMTVEQRQVGWSMFQKHLDSKVTTKIALNGGDDFMKFDFAIQALKKAKVTQTPLPVSFTSASLPNGEFKGTVDELIEQLEYESLVRKFDELQGDIQHQLKPSTPGPVKGQLDPNKLTDYQIAEKYNLPNSNVFGKHPLMEVLQKLTGAPGSERRNLRSFFKDMAGIRRAMQYHLAAPGVLGEKLQTAADLAVSGNSLRFDKKPGMKPVVATYSDKRLQERVTETGLNNLMQHEAMRVMDQLINVDPAMAPQVSFIAKAVTENPERLAVMQSVGRLVDGTQAGTGVVTTQAFNFRDIPTLLAADDVAGSIRRQVQKLFISKRFEQYTPTFGALAATNNAGSMTSVALAVNQLRKGWDVMATPQTLESGKHFALQLDPASARNQKFWKEMTGEDMPVIKDEDGVAEPVMMSMLDDAGNVVPVVMDELALGGLQGITKLSHGYLSELNSLRAIQGLPAINKREWHVPFYDMTKKDQVYLVDDATGEIKHVVSGATEQDAAERALSEVLKHQDAGKNYSMRTATQLRDNFKSVHAEWTAPENFAVAGKQTGGIKGKAKTETIDISPDVIKGALRQLENNYDSIFKQTMATIFEPQLEYAARVKKALPPGSAKAVDQNATVFDQYRRALLQLPSGSEKTALGAAQSGIERGMDKGLRKLWDVKNKALPGTRVVNDKAFAGLNHIYSASGNVKAPFNDLASLIARSNKTEVPWTSRGVFAAANEFALNMVLRVLDLGMPAINFASLLAVSPAVMKSMQRGANETAEHHASRVGIYTSSITGEGIAVPNPMRFVQDALHGFWDPAMKGTVQRQRDLGLFDQEAAERIILLTHPFESAREQSTRKVIDFLSKPTDWSEQLSRQIAFTMAYRTAKRTMQLGEDNAILFGHKFANSVVGDYRTSNKPQIFQGAVGMPFGLFTTWSWNFLQRFYGDLEGGRMGAAAYQAVAQQLLFGVESMPGADFYIENMSTSYDGKSNVVDKLDQSWGKGASDFIMHGGMSALTGMSIQARASVAVPGLLTTEGWARKIPALGVAQQLTEGFSKSISSLSANGGVNIQQLQEIASVHAVNGFAKTMAQVGLGYSVDKNHNMIVPDMRTLPNIASHMLELKTNQEYNAMTELRRDATTSALRAQRASEMKNALTTQIRAGELTDESLESVLKQYHKSGGKEFRQLVRDAALKSTVDKPTQLLMKKLKANDDANGTARLLSIQEDD